MKQKDSEIEVNVNAPQKGAQKKVCCLFTFLKKNIMKII